MMRAILICMLLVLTSCATTYHAERIETDGTRTVLNVNSHREFPGGIEIIYNRDTGLFELKAGEVRDDSAEAMRDVILGVVPLLGAIQ